MRQLDQRLACESGGSELGVEAMVGGWEGGVKVGIWRRWLRVRRVGLSAEVSVSVWRP